MTARETVDILHYVDRRVDDVYDMATRTHVQIEQEIDRRITGVIGTMNATATSLEHRLSAMNEFRAALADQATRFVTGELFSTTVAALNTARDTGLDSLKDRIYTLEQSQARAGGRAQGTTQIIAIMGLFATIVTLIVLFVHLNA